MGEGQPRAYLQFRRSMNVLMGAIVGFLVLYPFAVTFSGLQATVLLLLGFTFGGLTGYRRRESHLFFYFALLCICILSTLITFSGMAPETTKASLLEALTRGC